MHSFPSISVALEKGGATQQDRVEVVRVGNRLVIALADGAGGTSGGAEAAEAFVRFVTANAGTTGNPGSCAVLLERADQIILADTGGGETTGILAVIEDGRVWGSSVGDSSAWLFAAQGNRELTLGQKRRPFLGSGEAKAREFVGEAAGVLIIASDGLWKYTSHAAIVALAIDGVSDAQRFTQLVRLKSGAFPDDVAVVIARFP